MVLRPWSSGLSLAKRRNRKDFQVTAVAEVCGEFGFDKFLRDADIRMRPGTLTRQHQHLLLFIVSAAHALKALISILHNI